MGARVYVKGVEQSFHVEESPKEVLDLARVPLPNEALPMVELTLARPLRGQEPAIHLDPWGIAAVTHWQEPGA